VTERCEKCRQALPPRELRLRQQWVSDDCVEAVFDMGEAHYDESASASIVATHEVVGMMAWKVSVDASRGPRTPYGGELFVNRDEAAAWIAETIMRWARQLERQP